MAYLQANEWTERNTGDPDTVAYRKDLGSDDIAKVIFLVNSKWGNFADTLWGTIQSVAEVEGLSSEELLDKLEDAKLNEDTVRFRLASPKLMLEKQHRLPLGQGVHFYTHLKSSMRISFLQQLLEDPTGLITGNSLYRLDQCFLNNIYLTPPQAGSFVVELISPYSFFVGNRNKHQEIFGLLRKITKRLSQALELLNSSPENTELWNKPDLTIVSALCFDELPQYSLDIQADWSVMHKQDIPNLTTTFIPKHAPWEAVKREVKRRKKALTEQEEQFLAYVQSINKTPSLFNRFEITAKLISPEKTVNKTFDVSADDYEQFVKSYDLKNHKLVLNVSAKTKRSEKGIITDIADAKINKAHPIDFSEQ